jgi:Flp pilus assembly protein TadG
MMFSLGNHLRTLTFNERGAAVIEMALVAPIFAALLIGMVDLGRAYSTKLQLEQASQRAIEKVMNGQADTTVATALKTEAANTAGVPLAQATVDFWLECDGTRQTNYNTACGNGQVSRRYLSVTITNDFTPMFTSRRMAGSNSDGSFTLTGATGVRIQ